MENEETQQPSIRKDPFSRMMFPPRSEENQEKETITPVPESTIDYIQLMESVDTLMTVYDELKPSLKKLSPVLISLLTKLGSEKK